MKKQQIKALEQRAAEVEEKVIKHLKKSPDHKRPVTRRDFLRIGALNTMTYVAAPSLLATLGKMGVAEAAECVANTNPNISSMITVNMSGGWSLAGNWVPYTRNNQPLTNYRSLGVVSQALPSGIVTAFANGARFYDTSNTVGFLAGLKDIPGAADALARGVFVAVPTFSMDDSNVNRMDAAGLAYRAGLSGTVLPLLGTSRTRVGVSNYAALGLNPPPPLQVDNVNSILSAVSFTGTSLGQFNAAQQQSIMRLIKNMSDKQALSVANLSGGAQFRDLIECATGRNLTNNSSNIGAQLDYRNNVAINNIWAGETDDREKKGSVAFNVLSGYSGAGGIEMGGYDYHDNLNENNNEYQTRTFAVIRAGQDLKNRRAGQTVGRILASAQALNKKVFIVLTSDGSVSANDSNKLFDKLPNEITIPNDARAWNGDSGERSCLAFIAYDPARTLNANGQQIGGFAAGGTTDRTFLTGADVENASLAIFANWAKFSGDTNLYARGVADNTRLSPQILNEVIKI
jgi:hypothetical protein